MTAVGLDGADLRAFVAAIFVKNGMRADYAATMADVLVWADLRGIDSHGVERVPRYLDLVARGDIDLKGEPQLQSLADALFLIDGGNQFGAVPMSLAMHEAVERARRSGVALGTVRRFGHSGALGYYAQWIARQGMAAIVLGAGTPLMAYHGAKVPSLSTSPLAIAVPGGPSGVTMLDMASSIASNGRLRLAQRNNEQLPPGMALDAQGAPTTDPAKALIPLPVGGPKGAGLALMFECLTSVMAGAPLLTAMLAPGKKAWHTQSQMVIAIDISKFRPVEDYASDIDLLDGIIHALPRLDPDEPIRLPGERSEKEAEQRARSGIPLSDRLRRQLVELAQKAGVTPPSAML
ncbi:MULTISPECIES: Ldh family oxidoreductase [unclassified Beijerinckia]|uniref:Ldh family oxidoreductase n=1 Tax=unclassified Beijerinckia TaxID=2638183 RepID=UPI0008996E10|nr:MULTISPECIES: Ldh family oxidoreductase [unclassified Beijerinckia]MDH7796602.1 ureidoglycolate dehydrogenase (NAD+) [Beijerinckia sp. GAS462]SEC52094.1 ureidoglycolate dehydrogenase (NAD+) [Beijerinckia sp. 28-YEA-48]